MLNQTRDSIAEMVWSQVRKCRRAGRREFPDDLPRFSPEQEAAYRLCHQDFFGLSRDDAADILGSTPRGVNYMLSVVKKEAPQLFPILPQRSAKVHFLFTVENMIPTEIANHLGISVKTVNNILWGLYSMRKETGLYFRAGSRRRITYEPWMDIHIKQEF